MSDALRNVRSARAIALSHLDDEHDAATLISEVEKRQGLWDPKFPQANPKAQEKSWNDIIAILKCEKKVAKNKWRGLIRKMTAVLVDDMTEEERVQKFPLYPSMKFLEPKLNAVIAAEKGKTKENSHLMSNTNLAPPISALSGHTFTTSPNLNVSHSDEGFFACITNVVAQIDPQDQISFRIDAMKLLNACIYKTN